MNVNIFLRQFKAKNEDIVANIANGDVEKFGGVERLKGLLKVMPEKQEVSEGMGQIVKGILCDSI